MDPRDKSSRTGIIELATRFTSFTTDEMDDVTMEFSDYRAASDDQLPGFDSQSYACSYIDHLFLGCHGRSTYSY